MICYELIIPLVQSKNKQASVVDFKKHETKGMESIEVKNNDEQVMRKEESKQTKIEEVNIWGTELRRTHFRNNYSASQINNTCYNIWASFEGGSINS